jgi:predicted nucleotidyltransferase
MKAINKKMGLWTLKVISVEDLIQMKSESGRPQDVEDIKVLKELIK